MTDDHKDAYAVHTKDALAGWDLKHERRRHGLSARELAEAMGIGRSRVVTIEGQRRLRLNTITNYRLGVQIALRLRADRWRTR
jgi:transcriptional regulator with XRE-family HTH domain